MKRTGQEGEEKGVREIEYRKMKSRTRLCVAFFFND